MPHPPPHIWVHPRDRSLQLLYLHYVTMLHSRITLQIYRKEGRAALLPHQLRGPPPLSSAHAPPWHLVMTPAPAGLNAQGSGHRLASESNRGLSKARGCSSSIMDPHSCDHLHGSATSPISPCSSKSVGSSSSGSPPSPSACPSP